MSCRTSATKLVQSCANKLEKTGKAYSILRSVDATETSHWLIDMAIEMRKACEEDVGIPGWHSWLDALLHKHAYIRWPLENTTDSDIVLRNIVEVICRNVKDGPASACSISWEHWALELMDQYEVCDKSALTEPFDVDEAQEALATCFKDYEVRIKQLQARIKELESTAGPAFTEDKE